MKLRRSRSARRFELLEARECPAVTITAGNNANLKVVGSSANLVVQQEGATSFRVIDNGADRGVYSTTLDVLINMAGGNDTLTVDLNGWTTPRHLKVQTGGGTNAVTVREGMVNGDLLVTGAGGADAVTLGNAVDAMAVKGLLKVSLAAGVDSLTIRDLTTLQNNVTVGGANAISVQQGSALLRDLIINSDSKGTAIALAGVVNHDVKFNGTRTTALESLVMTSTAVINHDLIINGDGVGQGNGGKETIVLAGQIDGDLKVNTSGGADTVTLSATLAVGAVITVDLGRGNDTLIHAVTVDPGHVGSIHGGLGQDTLTQTTAVPALLTKTSFEL